jgi:hypothetical protein
LTKFGINFCDTFLGAPTLQHIFSPPSLLTAHLPLSLALVSAPRSKPNTSAHHTKELSLSLSTATAPYSHGSKHFTSEQLSLSLLLSLSGHPTAPSRSTLTALAKLPFSVPQPVGLIQQATPTNSANRPMAGPTDQQSSV